MNGNRFRVWINLRFISFLYRRWWETGLQFRHRDGGVEDGGGYLDLAKLQSTRLRLRLFLLLVIQLRVAVTGTGIAWSCSSFCGRGTKIHGRHRINRRPPSGISILFATAAGTVRTHQSARSPLPPPPPGWEVRLLRDSKNGPASCDDGCRPAFYWAGKSAPKPPDAAPASHSNVG